MDRMTRELQLVYEDISASFLALANALQKKGLLSKAEIREAAQERLLTLTVGRQPRGGLNLLRLLATDLPDAGE